MQRSHLWLSIPVFVIVLTLLLWNMDQRRSEPTAEAWNSLTEEEKQEVLLRGIPPTNGLSAEQNKALERKLLEGINK